MALDSVKNCNGVRPITVFGRGSDPIPENDPIPKNEKTMG